MNAAGPDRRANVIVQPADEVVADVFGVQVHVGVGLGVLLADLDGVDHVDPPFGGDPCRRQEDERGA